MQIALDLIEKARTTYRNASESARHRLNLVFFERVFIGDGQIRALDFREPFRTIFGTNTNAGMPNTVLATPGGVSEFELRLTGEPDGTLFERQNRAKPPSKLIPLLLACYDDLARAADLLA